MKKIILWTIVSILSFIMISSLFVYFIERSKSKMKSETYKVQVMMKVENDCLVLKEIDSNKKYLTTWEIDSKYYNENEFGHWDTLLFNPTTKELKHLQLDIPKEMMLNEFDEIENNLNEIQDKLAKYELDKANRLKKYYSDIVEKENLKKKVHDLEIKTENDKKFIKIQIAIMDSVIEALEIEIEKLLEEKDSIEVSRKTNLENYE